SASAKSVLGVHYGTPLRTTPSRTITRVMKLSVVPRHRFFTVPGSNSPYELAAHATSSPPRHLGHSGSRSVCRRSRPFHLRRHFRNLSQANGLRLLLLLPAIQDRRRLHQNV